MKHGFAFYGVLSLMLSLTLVAAAQLTKPGTGNPSNGGTGTGWGGLLGCGGQISAASLIDPHSEVGFGASCTPSQGEVCIPYGDTFGLGGCLCGTVGASSPPPNAQCETCSDCGGQNTASNPSGGGPISIASGNTYIRQTDIKPLPGVGFGVGLSRTWNSLWPDSQASLSVGIFGANWRSTYEEFMFFGSDGYEKYSRADGSYWSFGNSGSGYQIAAPSNLAVTLTNDGVNWTVTFQNGEKRLFDVNFGQLRYIIDRNGNTTQLLYDGFGRLQKVVDPLSRYLVFQYGLSNSPYLVTSVTSSVGHTVTYAYNQNQLISVTETDGTVYNFEYNDPNQNLITAVKDAQGKILEAHTYDGYGRGLTSVRANGAEAVTVSYQSQ